MPDHASYPYPVVTGFRVRGRRKNEEIFFVEASLTGSKKRTQDTHTVIYMLISHWIRQNWNFGFLPSSPYNLRHLVGGSTSSLAVLCDVSRGTIT
jgi:hypothetical protein